MCKRPSFNSSAAIVLILRRLLLLGNRRRGQNLVEEVLDFDADHTIYH